jgi:amino acid transporter
MAGLIWLAYKWKEDWLEAKNKKSVSPTKIGFSGFAWMVLFVLGMWLLPALNLPAELTFIYLAALPWLGVHQMKRWNCEEWSESRQWVLAVGLLTPWLSMSIIGELQNAARPDDTRGLIAAALLVLAGLLLLHWRIGMREKEQG